jgi:hypothetical protein
MKYKETIKTIVIAVLISGIACFVAGARYQSKIDSQVKTVTVQADSVPKQ